MHKQHPCSTCVYHTNSPIPVTSLLCSGHTHQLRKWKCLSLKFCVPKIQTCSSLQCLCSLAKALRSSMTGPTERRAVRNSYVMHASFDVFTYVPPDRVQLLKPCTLSFINGTNTCNKYDDITSTPYTTASFNPATLLTTASTSVVETFSPFHLYINTNFTVKWIRQLGHVMPALRELKGSPTLTSKPVIWHYSQPVPHTSKPFL